MVTSLMWTSCRLYPITTGGQSVASMGFSCVEPSAFLSIHFFLIPMPFFSCCARRNNQRQVAMSASTGLQLQGSDLAGESYFRFMLYAKTADHKWAGVAKKSLENISVAFFVRGAWTAPQTFIHKAVAPGEQVEQWIELIDVPSKLRFTNNHNDAWGFEKLWIERWMENAHVQQTLRERGPDDTREYSSDFWVRAAGANTGMGLSESLEVDFQCPATWKNRDIWQHDLVLDADSATLQKEDGSKYVFDNGQNCIKDVPDETTCQQLCQKEDACKFWTYGHQGTEWAGNCWLKPTSEDGYDWNARSSGPKQCS